MTSPELEAVFADLATMPAFLEDAARRVSEADRLASVAGGFCFVEHAWHLADLEREGYGERIRRLRSEDDPFLPDFAGDRIARERDYRSKPLAPALAAFAAARAANLAALRAAAPSEWTRAGRQDGVGVVTLADVPRMMREHDASHRSEIAALLAGTAASEPALR